MEKCLIGRVYRHFKGDYYIVENIALDCETCEEVVVYRQLYGDGKLWVRPLKSFISLVDKEKYPNATQTRRFELVEIESKKIDG